MQFVPLSVEAKLAASRWIRFIFFLVPLIFLMVTGSLAALLTSVSLLTALSCPFCSKDQRKIQLTNFHTQSKSQSKWIIYLSRSFCCRRHFLLSLFDYFSIKSFNMSDHFSSFISSSSVHAYTLETAKSSRGGEVFWQTIFTTYFTAKDMAGIWGPFHVVTLGRCLGLGWRFTCFYIY